MSKYGVRQKSSWLSLSLLLFNYAIQGYWLYSSHQPLLVCLLIGGYILIQLVASTAFEQQVESTIQWFGSDVIHLISILVIAFFIAVASFWSGIFDNLLLTFTAEILARLDLQQAGMSQIQRLIVLTLCLVLGLTAGWMTNALVA